MKCRVCKCTEDHPCDPPCAWAAPELCTTCAYAIEHLDDWHRGAAYPSLTALLRELKKHIYMPGKPGRKGKRKFGDDAELMEFYKSTDPERSRPRRSKSKGAAS